MKKLRHVMHSPWVTLLAVAASGAALAAAPEPSQEGLMAAVAHGSEITLANTGPAAWRGPAGETCTEANMRIYPERVNASALGPQATCVWLKKGLNIDADISLTAARIDAQVSTYPQGKSITLRYCVIHPPTPAVWSLGDSNFSATRCQILGSVDGVRYSGERADVLIENYIRIKAKGDDDHNDGVQMYGAIGGGVLLRNNIDGRPVGGGGGMNGALFIADGVTGVYKIRDNYLSGGNFTLRLHENGFYRVTGNIIEKDSYVYGPVTTANARPRAFREWSDNRLSDGTPLSP